MEWDKKVYTIVTAVAKATLSVFSPPAEGVAEDSVRTGRGKILDAVEQMTLQLKQLRKDRDKLTGAQGDHVSQ